MCAQMVETSALTLQRQLQMLCECVHCVDNEMYFLDKQDALKTLYIFKMNHQYFIYQSPTQYALSPGQNIYNSLFLLNSAITFYLSILYKVLTGSLSVYVYIPKTEKNDL